MQQLADPSQCGARTRKGTPCRNSKGKNTDHPGQGRCWLHGGATPIKHGRYSSIKRTRVGELAEQFEADPNPLDLKPELAEARALYADFVERFDDFQEALLAWHESYRSGDEDSENKPRQLLDPADAMRLLGEVTKIAKRIEDIQAQNAISRADFYRVLSEMGRVVDLIVTDAEMRQRIHDGWMDIRLA